VLTDFRVGITGKLAHAWPAPSIANCVTGHPPLESNTTQLLNLYARDFVVLLACSIQMYWISGPDGQSCSMRQHALQLVGELHGHATAGCLASPSDWELDFTRLDEKTCRFALAGVGVKVARALYRTPSHLRMHTGPHDKSQLDGRRLLDAVEIFAKEQRAAKPTSAVGSWNQAWVARETASRKVVHQLAGAADAMCLFATCYQLADAEGDEHLSCAARIDFCTCLAIGAGGTVGKKIGTQPGIVIRDMRNLNFHSRFLGQPDTNGYKVECKGDNTAIARALNDAERERMIRGLHPAELQSSEKLLVEHWEVCRVWNEAMRMFDTLAAWGHGCNAYGEASGWDYVIGFLESCTDLAPDQYACAPLGPGGSDFGKDRGAIKYTCDHCGKAQSQGRGAAKLKACSGCKTVLYCSKECQKADWKGGHKAVCNAHGRKFAPAKK
jgi:hypothetical protein